VIESGFTECLACLCKGSKGTSAGAWGSPEDVSTASLPKLIDLTVVNIIKYKLDNIKKEETTMHDGEFQNATNVAK
jgi:hypothetical protein